MKRLAQEEPAVIPWLIAVLLYSIAVTVVLYTGFAYAHMAPSGWEYPGDCCNGSECHQLPDHSIKATPQGWQTTQPPVDWFETGHTVWVNAILPYEGNTMPIMRPSGDKHFHVCAIQYLKDGKPTVLIRCGYFPETGN